jgi:hypothetical protein
MNPEDAEYAISLEDNPEDPALGELLGYPACCVAGYLEIAGGKPWIDKILDIENTENLSLYANKVGYLFRASPSFLFDYYPCSLSCAASTTLGRNNSIGLEKFGLTELVHTMKAKLLRPIVHIPGLLVQLPDARIEGRECFFDPTLIGYYEYGFSDRRHLFENGRILLDQEHFFGLRCRVMTFVDN